MATDKASDEPTMAERGARLVGELLKVWPAKEAPRAVHITFCEQLQRILQPFANGDDRAAKWFARLEREMASRLKGLRQLAGTPRREAEQVRVRLSGMVEQAPTDLGRVIRQARR